VDLARAKLLQFFRNCDGATAIEYGLIAALVAVGCIVAMTAFGNSLVGLFNTVDDRAGGAMDNAGV
jgi:pilus assembly protein Flp/PilA